MAEEDRGSEGRSTKVLHGVGEVERILFLLDNPNALSIVMVFSYGGCPFHNKNQSLLENYTHEMRRAIQYIIDVCVKYPLCDHGAQRERNAKQNIEN